MFRRWSKTGEFTREARILREIEIFVDEKNYAQKIKLFLHDCYELVIKSLKHLNCVMTRTSEKDRVNLYFFLSGKYLDRFADTFFGSRGEVAPSSWVIGSSHQLVHLTSDTEELERALEVNLDRIRILNQPQESLHPMWVYH